MLEITVVSLFGNTHAYTETNETKLNEIKQNDTSKQIVSERHSRRFACYAMFSRKVSVLFHRQFMDEALRVYEQPNRICFINKWNKFLALSQAMVSLCLCVYVCESVFCLCVLCMRVR